MAPIRPRPNEPGASSAAAATKTAARPTSEWNAATSCGRAVIWMRRAMKVPMAPPITMPGRIQVKSIMPGVRQVTTMAITMPTMP